MTVQALYESKKSTLQDCLNLIRSNDFICLGNVCNEPKIFCDHLNSIVPRGGECHGA